MFNLPLRSSASVPTTPRLQARGQVSPGAVARADVASCYKWPVMRSRTAVGVLGVFVAGLVSLVGLATLIGLLDRLWWGFETADVFRLQYLVVLVGAAVVALLLRRPRLAAMAAAFAAVNFAVLGIPVSGSVTAAPIRPTRPALRLVVANIEVGNRDFAAVRRLVVQTRPDLFGVTELTPVMARQLGEQLPGYRTSVIEARQDAYGIGVYSRVPLLSARIVRFPPDGPATVLTRLRVSGETVTVVVTHVHTPFAGSIHVRQLDALAAAARLWLGKRLVVCGDFNTPPWTGPLRRFAANARLRDLYGSHAWAGYSWPTWGSFLRVPLDNCFVGNGVAVTDHHDGPNVGSDHRPLVVDLGVGK
jgi:endonuclease/exonuclease/phosphatase (EEP) superfamily protein YafD